MKEKKKEKKKKKKKKTKHKETPKNYYWSELYFSFTEV